MESLQHRKPPAHKKDRIIIHFDYDCFYAAVFEAENPVLKSLPLGVQQKQIIVTCNYEARRRGLHKLQLITEAKKLCPEVVIVLGEDISRFRNASRDLYNYLAPFSWSRKVERLGFDEVWFDVTDTVDNTLAILNPNDLKTSFFQLSCEDPTQGFPFDATTFAGHTYPPEAEAIMLADEMESDLTLRLRLGSHLAMHMRHQLEHNRGYTSTVGISTNKLLSKLVGNLNKPKGQTTLLPPYAPSPGVTTNPQSFLDGHDIGKIPGVGFKMAQKLREHVLQRAASHSTDLVYGGTRENVSVRDVRLYHDVSAEKLEQLLAGPGAPHGVGTKVWDLLHGVDETEVATARLVPRQISIEDSYIRLDTMMEVLKELRMLAGSLLNRMRIDLLADDDIADFSDPSDDDVQTNTGIAVKVRQTGRRTNKKWIAHPRTLRLSTRPRQPLQPDGTRVRSFKRISHSAPLPTFVFNLHESVDAIADKLVKEALVPMFRHLHPQKSGWNLSLVNVAVTNMMETAGESKTAQGRDIGKMFGGQAERLKDFRVTDFEEEPNESTLPGNMQQIDDRLLTGERQAEQESRFHDIDQDSTLIDTTLTEDEVEDAVLQAMEGESCAICGQRMPAFALAAHERYHAMGE